MLQKTYLKESKILYGMFQFFKTKSESTFGFSHTPILFYRIWAPLRSHKYLNSMTANKQQDVKNQVIWNQLKMHHKNNENTRKPVKCRKL